MKRVVNSLIALWAAGLILAVVFIAMGIQGKATPETRSGELFKAGLGLIQVVVFGGVAALLLERFKDSQQRAKELEARRREIAAEARAAYNALKKVRRFLGVLAGNSRNMTVAWATKHADALDRLGKDLMDPQLSLEHLAERAEVAEDLTVDAATLARCFRHMERQLNHVSDAMRAATSEVTEQDLTVMANFLHDTFGDDFKRPYHAAWAMLNGADLDDAEVRQALKVLPPHK